MDGDRDPRLLAEVGLGARDLARWDVVEEAWILLNETAADLDRNLLKALAELPAEARKERPILTGASAAAGSVLDNPEHAAESVQRRMSLDAAILHADWATREDTDTAVFAGSMRMLGERRLPSSRPGQSLEAAWRTKQEVDTLIDERSRAGLGPGRRSHALFRAFSARLALARADRPGAVSEANWAAILTDRGPVRTLAQGWRPSRRACCRRPRPSTPTAGSPTGSATLSACAAWAAWGRRSRSSRTRTTPSSRSTGQDSSGRWPR